MSKVIIHINGVITDQKSKDVSTSFKDVVDTLNANPGFDSIECIIRSGGGSVETGMAIYDLLKGWNVPIHTKAIGMCGSIATVIFLAGDTRSISNNCPFFIHNPYLSEISGDADTLTLAATDLNKVQNKMVALYMDFCKGKLDESQIRQMMKIQTDIESNDALSYGFATEIWTEMNINAYYQGHQINAKQDKMKNDKSFMKKQSGGFFSKLFGGKVQAFKATTNENAEVEITTASGDENYAIGDAVMLISDGSPATGEHTLPDGNTIVVDASGLITEIKPTADASANEIADLKAQLEKLKAENKAKEDAQANGATEKANLVAELAKETAKANDLAIKANDLQKANENIVATANAMMTKNEIKAEVDRILTMANAKVEETKPANQLTEYQKAIAARYEK